MPPSRAHLSLGAMLHRGPILLSFGLSSCRIFSSESHQSKGTWRTLAISWMEPILSLFLYFCNFRDQSSMLDCIVHSADLPFQIYQWNSCSGQYQVFQRIASLCWCSSTGHSMSHLLSATSLPFSFWLNDESLWILLAAWKLDSNLTILSLPGDSSLFSNRFSSTPLTNLPQLFDHLSPLMNSETCRCLQNWAKCRVTHQPLPDTNSNWETSSVNVWADSFRCHFWVSSWCQISSLVSSWHQDYFH